MTDYHIFLNETLYISDSINTQENITRTLNDSLTTNDQFFSIDFVTMVHNVVNYIITLGGLIN